MTTRGRATLRSLAVGAALWAGTATADAPPSAPAETTGRAEFDAGADDPLSKTKFAVYNSGWIGLKQYERDLPLFEEARPYALRTDLGLGLGKWRPEPVAGTADALRYDFGEMDRLAAMLNARGVRPYWAYAYLPAPLQATPGKPYGTTTRPARWGEALGAFAAHAKTSPSRRVAFHDIYNEPDNRDFFTGTVGDYVDLYRAGARGIRGADADAVVGGPAIAFTDAWVAPFLDAVTRERLPIDFFSFHFYPAVPYHSPTVAGVIGDMRAALAARPTLAHVEMHLNEYNSYRIDYPEGGRQDRFPLASAMLSDFAFFLTQPDLTQVNWAQFQDTGGGNWSGMISIGGHRKATFNAYALYQQMPVDRSRVTIDGASGVEALASADERRAAVLLWNRSGRDQHVQLDLAGVAFERGDVRVLRIDADHASWGDDPANERLVPVETRAAVATRGLAWSGPVPKDGVVYVEAASNAAAPQPAPPFAGSFVRALRYFPDRSTTSYADFDPRTWIARLGTGRNATAHEQVGAVVDDWPARVEVRVQTGGPLRKIDANSLLAVRLDYATAAGPTSSVLFHGPCGDVPDLHDNGRNAPMPWGTRRPADRAVAVPGLARFTFAPADHAPPGWTGRAEVSFVLQNAGAGTRATFQLLGHRP